MFVSIERAPVPPLVLTNQLLVRFDSVEIFWLVLTVTVLTVRVRPVEKVKADSLAFHVEAEEIYESAIAVPCQTQVPIVPTLVREEVTTVALRVVPERVPAGAMTAFPLAAVMRPLPLTVNDGIEVDEPKEPTFALTVAKVRALVLLAEPSKELHALVASPVSVPIVLGVVSAAAVVAVLAFPVKAPTKEVEVTEVSPARVVEVAPRAIFVLPTVREELARLAFAMAVPFQTPVVIVPRVVIEDCPT